MKKTIILFTSLDNDQEFEAWKSVLPKRNNKTDEINITLDDITLKIFNGKRILNNENIPKWDSIEKKVINKKQAIEFIKNLHEKIKNINHADDVVAIHFGGGKSYNEVMDNCLNFLSTEEKGGKKAKAILKNFNLPGKPVLTSYSIGLKNKKDIENWINKKTDNGKNFEKLYCWLKKNFNPELSTFKHRIVNLLEPLRIDVQGLTEKNFDVKYWKEVVKAHKNLSKEFQSAKNLIYGTSTSGASEPKSIKAIISNITDDEIKNYLNALLKKIEELFPEDRKKLTGDNTVNSLLDAIKSNNKKEFKRITTLHGNVYKKWMDELIDCIDQLMLEIQDNK